MFNPSFVIYFMGFNSFLNLRFLVDYISLQFFSVLMVIVGSVFIFSLKYMHSENVRYVGFMWMVILFVCSMVVLIFRQDWIALILGWDWLGISSFFLVAFYNSDSSWRGRLKTYFTNRLGDGFFLFVLRMSLFSVRYLSLSASLFFMGFFVVLTQTKRAQLPFRAWLPAAMAAPTPVSALVHSSTLVTAGIFILIRSLVNVSFFSEYIFFIGLITLFIGRLRACSSYDMKKVVAFSTLSHLGFMVVCLSSGVSLLAFFHLIVHARFKALLFICVGSLIVLNNHSQDLRQVRFSFVKMFLIWGAVVSVISLCGFPFFSGFFSKDFVIEYFFFNYKLIGFFLFLRSLALSVNYSFRLIARFLKVNWLQVDIKDYRFLSWYLLPLLGFSLVLGVVQRRFCFSMFLVGGTVLLKVVIYFFLFCGFFLGGRLFSSLIGSSISLLDSLGQLVPLQSEKITLYHMIKDQGMLTFIREKSFSGLSPRQSIFENNLNNKLFYVFFLFIFLMLLF